MGQSGSGDEGIVEIQDFEFPQSLEMHHVRPVIDDVADAVRLAAGREASLDEHDKRIERIVVEGRS